MSYNYPEYQRKWRKDNAEVLKEKDKLKYIKNRKKILKQARIRYLNNIEAKKAYARKYYQLNKVKGRSKHADASNRRRARLKQLPTEYYDRSSIYNKFGGFCIVCDKKIDLTIKFPRLKSYTIHHIIPISKGGGDIINNVAPAHFVCNVSVGSKIPIGIKPKAYHV